MEGKRRNELTTTTISFASAKTPTPRTSELKVVASCTTKSAPLESPETETLPGMMVSGGSGECVVEISGGPATP